MTDYSSIRSLSDFSDYDSSEDEYHERAASHRQTTSHGTSAPPSKRNSVAYRALEQQGGQGRKGLLDPNDPFGDPFADENDTPMQERPRMQCKSHESSGEVPSDDSH